MGHLTETHKENLFIKTFQYDLLYIQSLASLTEEQVKIHFEEDVYKIYRGNRNALLFAREIPDHIEIDMGMRKNISFDRNGRIQNANHGGIKMITKDSNYNVIFPLGKGRASIVKQ